MDITIFPHNTISIITNTYISKPIQPVAIATYNIVEALAGNDMINVKNLYKSLQLKEDSKLLEVALIMFEAGIKEYNIKIPQPFLENLFTLSLERVLFGWKED